MIARSAKAIRADLAELVRDERASEVAIACLIALRSESDGTDCTDVKRNAEAEIRRLQLRNLFARVALRPPARKETF